MKNMLRILIAMSIFDNHNEFIHIPEPAMDEGRTCFTDWSLVIFILWCLQLLPITYSVSYVTFPPAVTARIHPSEIFPHC